MDKEERMNTYEITYTDGVKRRLDAFYIKVEGNFVLFFKSKYSESLFLVIFNPRSVELV